MSSGDSRSVTLASDWLEAEQQRNPTLKEQYATLQANCNKKLWHQVSEQLISFLDQSSFLPHLLPLHEQVVSRVHKKLNPFDYVRWAVAVAGVVGGPEGNVSKSLEFLEGIEKQLKPGEGAMPAAHTKEQDEQAMKLLSLELLRRRLVLPGADLDAAKEQLATIKKSMDHHTGVMDARIYAAYYQASYEYHKLRSNPQEYYTNALLYLTYTPLTTIPASTRAALASDIGLAALLGKNIHNFGELLQHPILKDLEVAGHEFEWLPKMLRTFNGGKIKEFDQIFAQVKDKYPALSANGVFLNQKLRIMTLMELVFHLPTGKAAVAAEDAAASTSSAQPRGRFLTFDEISAGCDLPHDQVEWLVMKALALGVLRGEIDQVKQIVRIHWVAPRVLDIEQVKAIQKRLGVWQQEVEQATLFVENNAQHVI